MNNDPISENLLMPDEMKENSSAGNETLPEKKILVAALGGGGARILQALEALHKNTGLSMLLLETDQESASLMTEAETLLLAANSWSENSFKGCGGDPMIGERAFARERTRITEKIAGYDFVVVCGCLGGGTASGGVRVLTSVLRNLAIPCVFLFSTPFYFESYNRKRKAEQCLADLQEVTELLIALPNDLLFSTLPPDTPADMAFGQAAGELAGAIFGITELFRSRKLIGPDYAEFSAALRKRKNSCAFGCGRATDSDGLDRCSLALEALLESPFLGGIDRLSCSNHVFLTMTGGKDLQIAEMKRTLENFSSLLPAGVQIASGVTIHPAFEGKVQITALAIAYEQHAENEKNEYAQETLWSKMPVKEDPSTFEQGLLDLTNFSKGIFSGCAPVVYRDEDLDFPTFQRKGIPVDKGSTGK